MRRLSEVLGERGQWWVVCTSPVKGLVPMCRCIGKIDAELARKEFVSLGASRVEVAYLVDNPTGPADRHIFLPTGEHKYVSSQEARG